MVSWKPTIWAVVAGSVMTMVIGFAWGGWVTGGTAERLALQRAAEARTAALVSVCLDKSKHDPNSARKLADLRAMTSSWEQRDMVVKSGWATVGAADADVDVAEVCAAQLLTVAGK